MDLNSDLGEGYGPWVMGDDSAMLAIVTSANVACGGHAGDPETMFRTLSLARDHNVTVGAHPGYNDPQGFGRRIVPMATAEIGRMVAAQVGALVAIAALVPIEVRYVKAHGALGNLAAADSDVAAALVDAVGRVSSSLGILAISGTELERRARQAGLATYAEIFADRGYLPSGQLVPRGQAGAMIHDPDQAADRLLGFLETGEMPVVGAAPICLTADSICVHGDSEGAVVMASLIKERLTASGVTLTSFVGGD